MNASLRQDLFTMAVVVSLALGGGSLEGCGEPGQGARKGFAGALALDSGTSGLVDLTTTTANAVTLAHSRSSFWASGWFWVFYSDGANIVYASGPDGATWHAPVSITADGRFPRADGFSVSSSGGYVHLAWSSQDIAGYPILYRRGVPTTAGTIAWGPTVTAVAASSSMKLDPVVSVASNGCPFIAYTDFTSPNGYPQVTTSTTCDGSWTTAANNPVRLSATSDGWYRVGLAPLAGGKMLAIYGGNGTVRSRRWSGSAWEVEKVATTSAVAYGTLSTVATGAGVHLVLRTWTNDIVHSLWSESTGTWSTQTTVQAGVGPSAVPSATWVAGTGQLHVFWAGAPVADHLYYRRRSAAGIWDASATDWLVQANTQPRVSAFQQSDGNLIGVLTESCGGSSCVLKMATLGYRQRADWLAQAGYGVAVNFLPTGAGALQAQANAFDVATLADQLSAVGARFLQFPLGQNYNTYNVPCPRFEQLTGYAPGSRCATRDLVSELHAALAPRGIKLILYLPAQTSVGDTAAQLALGLAPIPEAERLAPMLANLPLTDTFTTNWASVMQAWSDAYGSKVAGWWIDGCYPGAYPNGVAFDEAVAQKYAAALRHGNPDAIVAFNRGENYFGKHSAFDDFTAGEMALVTSLPTPTDVSPLVWHINTFLGTDWPTLDARYSYDQWTGWIAGINALGGVVTLNTTPIHLAADGPVGTIAPGHFNLLSEIASCVRSGLSCTPANAALLKPVIASSEFSSDYSAGKAVDGVASTAFSSAGLVAGSLQVDLGRPTMVTKVSILPRLDADNPWERSHLLVRASNDPTFASSTTMGAVGGVPLPPYVAWDLPISPGYYRYVRVERTTALPLLVSELKVFDDGRPALPNVAIGKAAVASSTTGASYVASKGVDGLLASLWASDGVETNPWLQVDLGRTYKVSALEIVARQDGDQAFARANFQVRASNDQTFATYTILGSQGATPFAAFGTWTAAVTPGSFRYLRAQRTNNGGHFNLAELRVFSDGSP